MSKAFTTDSDDEGGQPEAPALPPGTRNYMTKAGAERLRAEVDELTAERRRLGTDVESKGRAERLERRLRFLIPRIEALEVIDPLQQPKDRALFGATITVTDEKNSLETWRIVGLDEMDLDHGWISWMSPLAEAILGKRAGDKITFMNRQLTVKKISYEP